LRVLAEAIAIEMPQSCLGEEWHPRTISERREHDLVETYYARIPINEANAKV